MLNAYNYVIYINIDKFNSMILRQSIVGEGAHFTHKLDWGYLFLINFQFNIHPLNKGIKYL